MTVLLFLVTIMILVGIHELGHFLAARASGVYVHEFAIGMGPILLSRKRGETLYSWRLIPIIGYVRMAGEDRLETGSPIPAERFLYKKPPYVRALISVSGPALNFLLALVVTLATTLAMSIPILQVADVIPVAPPAAALRPGDRVLRIGEEAIYTFDDVLRAIESSAGAAIDVVVRRDGVEQKFVVQPRPSTDGKGYEIGARFGDFAETNEVTSVPATSALYVAGLAAGDRIVAVAGEAVKTRYAAVSAIETALGQSDVVQLDIVRGGTPFRLTLQANGGSADEILRDVKFANLGIETRRLSFAAGVSLGLRTFTAYVTLLGQTLRDLVAGSPEAREAISGPVGIARMVRQGWALGLLAFLQLLGFLSLNFAIINMIPFPGLDGSRVVFAVVEWVRRKPIPPQREGLIHAIGFVVLLVLLVLVTYRDILRPLQ